MSKTLRTLGLAALFLAGGVAHADSLRFGVAAEPYPPFATKQANGQWTGFEIDLINKLCARMQAKCEIAEVAWDGIIPALAAKKIDVIFASMSITPEREKQIAFSHPYYYTPTSIAAPKGTNVTLTPAGMKGKMIGVQISTVSADYLKKYYEGVAQIRYYDIQDAANADLLAGRVDMVMADSLAISAFVDDKNTKAAGIVKVLDVPHNALFGSGVGAGIRKEDAKLKARLDRAVDELLPTKEYDQLSKQYFGINLKPVH